MIVRLCLSTKSLLHGDSAAAVLMVFPKLLQVHANVLSANSRQLSIRPLFGGPHTDIQLLKICLKIVLGCLFEITADAEVKKCSLIDALDPLPQFSEMYRQLVGQPTKSLYGRFL